MLRLKDGFTGERSIVLPPVVQDMMQEDPMISMLHITDIGYYPKAEFHYRERPEPIDQNVFIHVVDGAGWFEVDGKHYEAAANQYFILPAGMPHAYGAHKNRPWTIYWLHFRGSVAWQFLPQSPGPIDLIPDARSRIGDRISLFEEMFLTLKNGYTIENIRYISCVLHYYLGTLRYERQFDSQGNAPDSNIVDLSIHFMKENLEKKLSLKEIADSVGLSPTHFSMLFKQRTGHSPMKYFTLIKIQEACAMLDETDMKISQISFKTGIDDTYYFSRLFSKTMGMSPKEYRSRAKG